MKMIFLSLVFLLGGLMETEAMAVTGWVGEDVTIKCSHTYAFSNVKYFCGGACNDEDVLISSRKNEKDPNGKYSIKDEGNTFSVTIFHLTEGDSGTYWCGIERTGVDTYNKVDLTVINRKPEDKANLNTSSFSRLPVMEKVAYIGASLGVAVLALAIALLIFFRHRNRDIDASSGKHHDTAYATVSSQKQEEHLTTSSKSTNEDQDPGSRTNSSSTLQHQDTSRDPSNNIYSNVTVSTESQTPPDDLFYSTVSFNKHTDCSTLTPHTAALTYSTIKHKATDESVVYSNV